MKTPDEIKKGLEYCVQLACPLEECPYYSAESCAQDKTYDALAYIQQLEVANAELLTKVEQLETKCHQLERERDAAVADITEVAKARRKTYCKYCKHSGRTSRECSQYCWAGNDGFEWRGVKEE